MELFLCIQVFQFKKLDMIYIPLNQIIISNKPVCFFQEIKG